MYMLYIHVVIYMCTFCCVQHYYKESAKVLAQCQQSGERGGTDKVPYDIVCVYAVWGMSRWSL